MSIDDTNFPNTPTSTVNLLHGHTPSPSSMKITQSNGISQVRVNGADPDGYMHQTIFDKDLNITTEFIRLPNGGYTSYVHVCEVGKCTDVSKSREPSSRKRTLHLYSYLADSGNTISNTPTVEKHTHSTNTEVLYKGEKYTVNTRILPFSTESVEPGRATITQLDSSANIREVETRIEQSIEEALACIEAEPENVVLVQ